MAPKVWFITGCSVGLGKKLAEEVLRRGDKVIATARNLSAMEDLAAAGATTIQLDITASQEELNGKVQEAIQAAGHIDVLVHNAASFQMGTWEDLTPELLQAQFATNFFGPYNLTHAVLPHMRERGEGTFVFINSTSKWQTFAGVSAYGASKAALDRFVDGLTTEMGPAGVKVLSLDVGSFESTLTAAHRIAESTPPTEHHGQLMDILKGIFPQLALHPVIDINKLASLAVDLVKGEGLAKGREMPVRFMASFEDLWKRLNAEGSQTIPQSLPVGSDAFGIVKKKCEYTLKMLQDWEEVIKSADVQKEGQVNVQGV